MRLLLAVGANTPKSGTRDHAAMSAAGVRHPVEQIRETIDWHTRELITGADVCIMSLS
jgi:hypothetical protein